MWRMDIFFSENKGWVGLFFFFFFHFERKSKKERVVWMLRDGENGGRAGSG